MHMICFKYRLSKLYFATIHILNLEHDPTTLRQIPRSDFWRECLELFSGLTFFQNVLDLVTNHLIPE
jgi:hypothetical protein